MNFAKISKLQNKLRIKSRERITLYQQSTVCKLGALQKQVDLQGMFVKIGDLLKFKKIL